MKINHLKKLFNVESINKTFLKILACEKDRPTEVVSVEREFPQISKELLSRLLSRSHGRLAARTLCLQGNDYIKT